MGSSVTIDAYKGEPMEEQKKRKTRRIGGMLKKIPLTVRVVFFLCIMALCIGIGALVPTKFMHRETVLDFGFKDVGFLVTQEWYGRVLEDGSKERKLFDSISIPFTKSYLIFSLDVEVLAGTNFEEIEYTSKKDADGNNIISITLPHAVLYKSYEVKDSFVSYLDQESWFTNISAEEQQKLKDAIVKKGEEQALQSGVLGKADQNTQKVIVNMIKSNELTRNYKVEFEYK